jgi:hypothetical protein
MSFYNQNLNSISFYNQNYKYNIKMLLLYNYSIPSLVRGPSVVRGFERQNLSSNSLKFASK